MLPRARTHASGMLARICTYNGRRCWNTLREITDQAIVNVTVVNDGFFDYAFVRWKETRNISVVQ